MTTVTRVRIGKLLAPFQRLFMLRRTRGSARALYSLLRKFATWPLARRCVTICAGDLWRRSLTDTGAPARTPASLVVRQSGPQDVSALAAYYDGAQQVRTRLDRGDLCVITLCQEKIGAGIWLTPGPGEFSEDAGDFGCTFRFPKGVAWTYDGRGTKFGAWGTLMARLPGILRELGIHEINTVIDCNNWKSIDAHRSLGYETIGVVIRGSLLGMAGTVCRPGDQSWRRLPVNLARLELRKS